jgi:hypothetical protein
MVKLEIVGCYFGHGSQISVSLVPTVLLKLMPKLSYSKLLKEFLPY